MFGTIIEHVTVSQYSKWRRKRGYRVKFSLAPVLSLPVDVFSHIIEYMIPTDGEQIVQLSTTCKLFRSLIFHNSNAVIGDTPIYKHITLTSGFDMFGYTCVNRIEMNINNINYQYLLSCNTLVLYSTSSKILKRTSMVAIDCKVLILDRCHSLFDIDISCLAYLPSDIRVKQTVFPGSRQSIIDAYGEKHVKRDRDNREYIMFRFTNTSDDITKLKRLLAPERASITTV